jgi:hypothetical protein
MGTVLLKWNECYPDKTTSPEYTPTYAISSLKKTPAILEIT